ncbi:MAG: WecB/TagA/CpsF family glycosyltransferase [Dethiobacter sp.]|jgi:N-acetylglucosaminyldiphosphoundecaprenol N-acetyl-beta-D-mannosaminyltransferase|nr:WecB/TagA/CpsF family glycosyltransferase [Dethiobacter sp.]
MERRFILGMPVDAATYSSAVELAARSVDSHTPLWIMAVNPEKIIKTMDDPLLRRLLLKAGLFIPDGAGILLAGKLLGRPFPGRVTGADLLEALVGEAAARGWKIYLLGAAPGVAAAAADIWSARYPGLVTAGVRDGYFTEPDEPGVVAEIRSAGADLLFVAMGSPRQEKFIEKYHRELAVPVCMGVGGSFDVVSGKAQRAPVWMQRLGLEWSYRLLKNPRRILRMAALPRFILLVLAVKLRLLKIGEEQK